MYITWWISMLIGLALPLLAKRVIRYFRSRTTRAQRAEAAALGKIALERLNHSFRNSHKPHLAESEQDIIKNAVKNCKSKKQLDYKMKFLRSLAAHSHNHRPTTTRRVLNLMGLGEIPEVFTDEHYYTYCTLIEENVSDYPDPHDWYLISQYALCNIEDARLVLSLVRERKIRTLDEVLSVLPSTKESPTALSGGVL